MTLGLRLGLRGSDVYYSMACSCADEIPRGLEFLLSRNRLNVAISRAQCIATQTVLDAARGIESSEVTPTKQLQLEFWTQLREYAHQRKTVLKFQKPLPQHWATLAIGRTDFFMMATVNVQDGEVSAQLVLNSRQAKAEFKELETNKDDIERQAGVQFEWRELPEKRQSRIETRRSANPNEQSTWPELFGWLLDRLELIHRVFGPRVKALLVSDDADGTPVQSEGVDTASPEV